MPTPVTTFYAYLNPEHLRGLHPKGFVDSERLHRDVTRRCNLAGVL